MSTEEEPIGYIALDKHGRGVETGRGGSRKLYKRRGDAVGMAGRDGKAYAVYLSRCEEVKPSPSQ